MKTVALSKLTLVVMLVSYVLLAAVVGASIMIPLNQPSYIDIEVQVSPLTVNTIQWIPEIMTKTFSAMEIEISSSALSPTDFTVSVIFIGAGDVQIASGYFTGTIGASSTETFSVAMTWITTYTTDDIVSGRVMVL